MSVNSKPKCCIQNNKSKTTRCLVQGSHIVIGKATARFVINSKKLINFFFGARTKSSDTNKKKAKTTEKQT